MSIVFSRVEMANITFVTSLKDHVVNYGCGSDLTYCSSFGGLSLGFNWLPVLSRSYQGSDDIHLLYYL